MELLNYRYWRDAAANNEQYTEEGFFWLPSYGVVLDGSIRPSYRVQLVRHLEQPFVTISCYYCGCKHEVCTRNIKPFSIFQRHLATCEECFDTMLANLGLLGHEVGVGGPYCSTRLINWKCYYFDEGELRLRGS